MAPPRPLAGLPPADPRAVARAWLVRRIAGAPLDAAPGLADATFADRAPGLCGSVLATLGDDAALAALPGEAGALRVLVDSDAFPPTTPAALAVAAEHLRGAVLDVVAAATDPGLLAPLHDRLAHACSALLQGALAPSAGAITVQDARAPADPRGRLTAEAERLVVAGAPFALLAVEVEDAAVVPAGVLAAAEAALRAALPAGALHAPDGPGSMLVLVRDADGRGVARALTQAVGAAATHHGAPLRAAAGVAQHPRDGDTPEGLLAHADGQLFAARAEGLPLA
jgi:hypothetical protein